MSSLRLVALGIAVFGLLLRVFNLRDVELWSDEVFSVTLAESSLLDLILAALRFDVHPPLYYVVIHVWGLFGTGDLWFLLSSVVLDVAAGLSLWWCATRLYGERVGLLALALFAIFPMEVSFAATLRMYALFSLLVVWLWYHLERAAAEPAGRLRLTGIAALGIASTLTHGAGFIIVFFIMLQAAVRVAAAQGRYGDLVRLVLAYVPVVLAAIYPVVVGAVREAGVGLEIFNAAAVGVHLTIFLLGYLFPFPVWSGYAAFLFLSAVALVDVRARKTLLCLVVVPMLGLLLLSLTVQPVFLFRTLGLLSPFVILVLALGVDGALRRTSVTAIAAALVLPTLFMASAVNYSLSDIKPGYREVAAVWVARSGPEAVLLTEGPTDFWGILRYDGSGPVSSALVVQPPVRDGMARLKAWLDGTILDRMGFFGQARYVTRDGRRVFVHVDPDVAVQEPRAEIWLLTHGATGCADLSRNEVSRFSKQNLTLLRCDPV